MTVESLAGGSISLDVFKLDGHQDALSTTLGGFKGPILGFFDNSDSPIIVKGTTKETLLPSIILIKGGGG